MHAMCRHGCGCLRALRATPLFLDAKMPGRRDALEELQEPANDLFDGAWERSVTSNGVPYYVNHKEGKTQWEHPCVTLLLERIGGLNQIKYGAYRTAMKLCAVQTVTEVHKVKKEILERSFRELGMEDRSQNNQLLSVVEIEMLLTKSFLRLSEDSLGEECTQVALNWLLKCYDRGRTGAVKVKSLKVGLIAICSATLEEKYRYLFSQFMKDDGTMSEDSLKYLLEDLLTVPQSVSEAGPFGDHGIQAAVTDCWTTMNLEQGEGLNQTKFLQWMKLEPMCIVWLPTLHRSIAAETIKHEAKCAVCRAYPIVGFRYRCLKCVNVDLCQSCFWTQKVTRSHKLTHPTKEYCMTTTSRDDVKDLATQMKNKLTRRYRHKASYHSYDMIQTQTRGPTQSEFSNVHARIQELAARLCDQEEEANDEEEEEEEMVHEDEQQRERRVPVHMELEPAYAAAQAQDIAAEKARYIADLEEENRMLRESLASISPHSVISPPPPPLQQHLPHDQLERLEVNMETLMNHNHMLKSELDRVRSSLSHSQEPSLASTTRLSTIGSRDEWSFMLGGESEKMKELTDELMGLFNSGGDEQGELDCDLLQAAGNVGRAMAAFVNKVDASIHSDEDEGQV